MFFLYRTTVLVLGLTTVSVHTTQAQAMVSVLATEAMSTETLMEPLAMEATATETQLMEVHNTSRLINNVLHGWYSLTCVRIN